MAVSMQAINKLAEEYENIDPEDDAAINRFLNTLADRYPEEHVKLMQQRLFEIDDELSGNDDIYHSTEKEIDLSDFDIGIDELKEMNELDSFDTGFNQLENLINRAHINLNFIKILSNALKAKQRNETNQHPELAAVKKEVVSDLEPTLTGFNIQIEKSKRQSLKIKAAAEGKTINAVLNGLIDNYLSD